jgi:hypothetical protein
MTASGEDVDNVQVFVPHLPSSPYPGLRPFQKAEWPIFFGREGMTDDVINLLMRKRLLVVHGTSGNGKSSLIRAGVLARLEQEHARSGVSWRTCAMNPGKNSLANLAESLAGVSLNPRRESIEFRRALNRGKQSAGTIAELLELNHRNRLCILIDQFEEVFHDGEVNSDRSSLLSEFLGGFNESPPDGLFVLVTMRSEFLGFCSRFPGLAEVINRAQYLLPRMDTENLLRAVRDPAPLYGGGVTEQLAERLIIDARTSQDELPLIQHGLSQLWEAGGGPSATDDRPVLDLQSYRSAQSLSSMISEHADRVTASVAGDASGNRIVEELFRAITAINSDGHAVRRPQSFGQLVAIAGTTEDRLLKVLDAFRRPGVSFVTPYPPAAIETDTLIDVSHEALIRNWKRISDGSEGWLQREFRDGLLWQSLRVQAESFLSNPASLLSEATAETRGAWLRGRNEAWAGRYGGMWSEVERLIDASRSEIQRRKQQDQEQKQHAERLRAQLERGARFRTYMVIAVVLSVLMGALSLFSVHAWRRAEAEALKAVKARGQAVEERQKAEQEKSTAEAALQKAEEQKLVADRARGEAVAERQRAEEEKQKAEAERQKAEVEMAKAEAALQQAIAAANRASKFQDESAFSYVASHGSNRDTLMYALASLDSEDRKDAPDSLKIAFFGQIVGQLAALASDSEIQSAIEVLIRDFDKAKDPSSANAIAQALSGLAANLNSSQAQIEANVLLKTIVEGMSSGQIKALVLVFGAMAPKVSQDIADNMKAFLVKTLMATQDPDLVSAIAVALSSLKWTPTAADSERLLGSILRAVSLTKDQVQLGNIGTLLVAMAPILGQQSAQAASDALRAIAPQAPEVLKSAINALDARVDQDLSAQIQNPAPLGLFQKVSAGRWCTSSRSYSLQLTGSTVVWRDNLGSVDIESIVSNNATDAQSITQKSVHPDGRGQSIGTSWTYRLGNADKTLNVRSSAGAPFSLTRC